MRSSFIFEAVEQATEHSICCNVPQCGTFGVGPTRRIGANRSALLTPPPMGMPCGCMTEYNSMLDNAAMRKNSISLISIV
jgi:hypothetical protein